jgi:hypothetical protein
MDEIEQILVILGILILILLNSIELKLLKNRLNKTWEK